MVVGGGLKSSGTDGTRESESLFLVIESWSAISIQTDGTTETAWFVLVTEWWTGRQLERWDNINFHDKLKQAKISVGKLDRNCHHER
jgi:hypothetical protein